jgi:polyferredoxin
MASYNSIINASFVAFVLIFILSLFFGRAYCSWFCPGCGIQEILSVIIKKKSKNSGAIFIKYFIFTIWVGTIIAGYVINGVNKIDLTYGMSDVTFLRKIILTIGAIVLIVPLTAVFGRFASCKYICWQVPFMIIGTKIRDFLHLRGLRLSGDNVKCNSCKACTKNCPMNLDVMEKVKKGNMSDSECILCANCIDHCNQKAINFTFKKSFLTTKHTKPTFANASVGKKAQSTQR